jgi:hypothetical protein
MARGMNVAIGALLCYIILLTERCVTSGILFYFCLSPDRVVTTTATKTKAKAKPIHPQLQYGLLNRGGGESVLYPEMVRWRKWHETNDPCI